MRISLMDLDISSRRRPFPNLALMKLSAHHKARGDKVFLNFPLCQPDITYASCVFSWHKPSLIEQSVIVGGSGIDLDAWLPNEIEHIMPDYSLYPNIDFSMGFTSRGCIRNCPFCLVHRKEGGIKAWASVREFLNPSLRRLILLDNNFFAAENCEDTLNDLIELQIETDINQGLDIRLLTDKLADSIKRMKAKIYRFAFDDIAYEKQVRQGIELLLKAGISPRKLAFYVLVGFQNDETAVDRMKLLASYGVDVYPMIYKGQDGKEPTIKSKWDGTIFWHGSRNNIRKFLRVVGRLN